MHVISLDLVDGFLLICYNMFYTFTKHESSDDIQCLSSGRTRWPQLSKQTCCRNHRDSFPTGLPGWDVQLPQRSFITATLHSFPKPFHSIEDHQSVGFWSATSGSSDSLQHKVQIIIPKRTSESVLFTNTSLQSFHGSFHFRFSHFASVESIQERNDLECVRASGSIVEPEFDRSARTGGKGGRPAFDVILPEQQGIREIIRLSMGFCWDSKKCWFFSIFFCWNSFYRFFLPQDFLEKWCYLWIPNCWEARCSNSQNQSTKPCRRGLHGPVLGAFFARHRPEVSHPVGRWFERHAL